VPIGFQPAFFVDDSLITGRIGRPLTDVLVEPRHHRVGADRSCCSQCPADRSAPQGEV
jgi:hypothetical protein